MQTQFISISSQKGGVGKSTITALVASYLHFTTDLSVAVIDCDYPQWTLENYRQKDLDSLKKSPEKMAEFKVLGKKAYPIISCEVSQAAQHMAELEGAVDLVLVDTPGTLNIAGITALWKKLDYIFIPLEPDAGTINSSLSYVEVLGNFVGKPGSNLKGFYCFWNKVVKTEKKTLYTKTEELCQAEGVPLLTAQLEQSVAYRKEEVRSTMLPLRKEFYHLGLISLLEEMQGILFAERGTAATV